MAEKVVPLIIWNTHILYLYSSSYTLRCLPAGPWALVSIGWLLDWLDSTRREFYTQHRVWTDGPPQRRCVVEYQVCEDDKSGR